MWIALLAVACAATPPPPAPDVTPTPLAPCPPTPNCVSTEADPGDVEHWIAAWRFEGDPALAQARLRALVAAQPRARVVEERADYLHATFTSRVWRFVDDVEFVVDPDAGVVRFRSASRVGTGDLGANRARMESLGASWGK